ncbi:septal ring lytic transglycosylase RlpA family protein [Bacteroidetes/Chlorobi group bacterium Naka2016]|jgi:rare lipoprotein A|nr:MAG: septal ring lytic transglycosylase RlpA family protein [Bacteroidetes/Chlorobi group bacterium Naka2016]
MRTRYFKLLLLALILLLSSCSSTVFYTRSNNQSEKFSKNFVEEGLASYYSDEFVGRTTANGEIYNPVLLTAAHRSLPFGTKVKVTNLKNGREVIVIINDRGPFVQGRIIDLSKQAAKILNFLQEGIVRVRIESVE